MKYKLITLCLAAALTAGAITGCGGSNNNAATDDNTPGISVESGMTSSFHQAIMDAYGEDYLPGMAFDEAMFSDRFGIDMADVKEFIAEVPMIGTHVDTLVIVEAAEGKGEAVETALNAYRDSLLADTMQYPMNLAKINASQVYTVGDYVFFLMLGAIDETSETEEAALEFAQAEVQKAVDAIGATIE